MEGKNFCGHQRGKYIVTHIIKAVITGIIIAAVVALLFGYIVMLLWNWLLPGLFGFKTIGFWQAFGIIFLAKILFGCGFHHKHHEHHKKERKYKGDWDKWRYYDEFWTEEGEKSFENFIEKKKEKDK